MLTRPSIMNECVERQEIIRCLEIPGLALLGSDYPQLQRHPGVCGHAASLAVTKTKILNKQTNSDKLTG